MWPMMRHTVGCAPFLFLSLVLSLFAGQESAALQHEVQAGMAAMQKGDFAAAEQHFRAAITANPNLPQVRANLGLAYYASNDFPLAIHQFELALRQDASLETARDFLSLSYAAVGDCAKATPGLKSVFGSSGDKKLRRVIGLSLEKCQDQAGDEMGADQTLQRLLADYPSDPDVLYQAGELYGRLSSELYLKLMKVAPHAPRTYQMMASVAASEGNWQAAIKEYQQALTLDPSLQGVHLQIAILLLTHSHQANAWQMALEELKEELRANPWSAQAPYEMGEIYRKHGELKHAVDAFNASLRADPAAVPARLGLAKTLRSLGQSSQALSVLEPALKITPKDPAVHFLLAALYRDTGNTARARAEALAFQKLQQTAPPAPTTP